MGATVQGNKNGLVPPTSTPILKTLQQFSLIGFRFQAEDGKCLKLKDILYLVALEMNLEVQPSMKITYLRELIKSSPLFHNGDVVNSLIENIIAMNEEKLRQEYLEEKRRQDFLEQKTSPH
ncbi:hypothetical protein CDAR_197701 [Caerostris darwini]|uniref:LAGLIDADG homing endonuclease n=1 Tax=Caerostris darwini TaxID=1538125 RepID=A0AAV4VVS3_9ARAC|nr:hypothetical protein CDAR_197701 [Caerostris darwini]